MTVQYIPCIPSKKEKPDCITNHNPCYRPIAVLYLDITLCLCLLWTQLKVFVFSC